MLTRKAFIYNNMMAAGTLFAGGSFFSEMIVDEKAYRLTVLHTNDVHSRIDPFPMDGGVNQGLGGVAARAEIIEKIRREEEHVLLLDAGDIFQGTPYFNFYKGEPEIRAMSSMGYDAAAIGNHDFDAGLENLAIQLTDHAKFPMLVSNYDFSGTPMEYKYEPYKTIKKGRIKIGVFGLGIEMAGLVPENLSAGTKYLDPVLKGNETAAVLKKEKNCDLIICLSHLGYQYSDNKVSDKRLANETENIDLIIGGHTHTFLNAPVVFKNKKGDDVLVNQVGWAGINLGRLDFDFAKNSKKKLSEASSITVTKKTEE
ncbi:MAG TPA: metallophosphatase [Chitinophagaceae bacterium]|nr:metallophosphatase [Chitinophagaceae bacterium]